MLYCKKHDITYRFGTADWNCPQCELALVAGLNALTEKDCQILDAMTEFGGSFVKHLAELCWHADGPNYVKLRTIFATYFDQYEKMIKK